MSVWSVGVLSVRLTRPYSTLQPSVWSLDISPAPPVPVIISSSDMVYSSVKFQRVWEFVCVALRADSCSWLRNNSCRREREETERERERWRRNISATLVSPSGRWTETIHSQTHKHKVIQRVSQWLLLRSRTNFLAHWLLLEKTGSSRHKGLPVATTTMRPINS